MVKIKKNIVTRGFSGKLEGIVFRVKAGKTYVASAPEKKSRELLPIVKNIFCNTFALRRYSSGFSFWILFCIFKVFRKIYCVAFDSDGAYAE